MLSRKRRGDRRPQGDHGFFNWSADVEGEVEGDGDDEGAAGVPGAIHGMAAGRTPRLSDISLRAPDR